MEYLVLKEVTELKSCLFLVLFAVVQPRPRPLPEPSPLSKWRPKQSKNRRIIVTRHNWMALSEVTFSDRQTWFWQSETVVQNEISCFKQQNAPWFLEYLRPYPGFFFHRHFESLFFTAVTINTRPVVFNPWRVKLEFGGRQSKEND